jgi:hypothetical protein
MSEEQLKDSSANDLADAILQQEVSEEELSDVIGGYSIGSLYNSAKNALTGPTGIESN